MSEEKSLEQGDPVGEPVVVDKPDKKGIPLRRCRQLQLASTSMISTYQKRHEDNLLEPVAQPIQKAPSKQTTVPNPLLQKKPKKQVEEPIIPDEPTMLRHAAPTPDYRPLSRTLSSTLESYMQSPAAPPSMNVYFNKQAEIESNSPYLTDVAIYTPQNRRSFYRFIEDNYESSFKPPQQLKGPPDPDACKNLETGGGKAVEAFLYQKFIREYVRNASPYRGILVYHGLGSGKTCSSIAAAEALYGTANKKIIVMTPSSLRPNFINEISFCGFRHFNVNNCWESITIPSEPGLKYKPSTSSMEYVYALEVLSLSKEFLNLHNTIWIPNFEKTDESDKTHYNKRTQPERDAIRRQITHMIENRITFISYNGISAAKLKSFALPDPYTGKRMFDDAVIVIDEVHNLTRLMQGNITQYIVGRKKKQDESKEDLSEPIVPGRWEPKLGKRNEPYKRAYLFYKLLTDARNSKIIGLSGTPIINFPEELGIMANLLAGYTECAEFMIDTTKDEVIHQLKTIIEKEPRVDIVRFYKISQRTSVLISTFQEGYQRSLDYAGSGVGVEYNENAQESILTIYPRIKATIQPILQKMGIQINEPVSEIAQAGSSKPSRNGPYVSYPRLPIDEETFRKEFINMKAIGEKSEKMDDEDDENNIIINRTVLQKRMTGLVSYYKGSKEDYMPRVTDHGIEKCAMSDYVLSKYSEARIHEIAMEKQNMKTSASLFEAVDMFSKMKNPSNYRFHSRALCNFAFPKTITRPFPETKEEFASETNEPEAEEMVYSNDVDEMQVSNEDMERIRREMLIIEKEEQMADAVIGTEDQEEAQGADQGTDEKKVDGGGIGDDDDDEDDDDEGDETTGGEYKDSMVGGMDPISTLEPTLPKAPLSEQASLPSEQKKKKKIVMGTLPPRLTVPKEESSVMDAAPAASAALAASAAPSESVAPSESAAPAASAAPVASAVEKTKIKKRMGILPSIAAPEETVAVKVPSKAAEFQRKIKAAMQALDDTKNEYLNLDDVVPERSLHYYSTKMDRMLRKISQSKGSNLVYSQFKTVEGIGAFGIAMKANGYVEIVIEGSDSAPRFSKQTADSLRKGPASKERRFITFTGEGSKDRRTLILNVFNGNFDKLPNEMRDIMLSSGYGENKNQTGDVCWVIGITGAGAEGISLKCCRSVHIMEPFWNNVRLDQVKGRAIRICSHKDLPVEDRHVDIYTYVTTFSKEQIKKKEGGVDATIRNRDVDSTASEPHVMTSDENVLRVSTKKDKINNEILKVMKETAVDCGLNVGDNQVKCVVFNGKPDQYLFDPDLEIDKSITITEFKKKKGTPKKAKGEIDIAADERKDDNVQDVTVVRIKGVQYLLYPKNKSKSVVQLFAFKDTTFQTPLGEADADPVQKGKYVNYHFYQ